MAQAESTKLFLDGARVIVEAIGGDLVKEMWDAPSVLEHQLMSGIVGHLARGAVLVVGEYLQTGVPDRPLDYKSAAEYFVWVVAPADEELHRAGAACSARVASVGQDELQKTLRARLAELESTLDELPPSTAMEVIGGKAMRLDDYLQTRIIEQCVHLDDLARSVGREPWSLPVGHRELAIATGIEIAERLHGTDAVLRSVYRRGFAEEAFPVI